MPGSVQPFPPGSHNSIRAVPPPGLSHPHSSRAQPPLLAPASAFHYPIPSPAATPYKCNPGPSSQWPSLWGDPKTSQPLLFHFSLFPSGLSQPPAFLSALTAMTTVSSPWNLAIYLSPRITSESLRGLKRHITLMLHSAGSAILGQSRRRRPLQPTFFPLGCCLSSSPAAQLLNPLPNYLFLGQGE